MGKCVTRGRRGSPGASAKFRVAGHGIRFTFKLDSTDRRCREVCHGGPSRQPASKGRRIAAQANGLGTLPSLLRRGQGSGARARLGEGLIAVVAATSVCLVTGFSARAVWPPNFSKPTASANHFLINRGFFRKQNGHGQKCTEPGYPLNLPLCRLLCGEARPFRGGESEIASSLARLLLAAFCLLFFRGHAPAVRGVRGFARPSHASQNSRCMRRPPIERGALPHPGRQRGNPRILNTTPDVWMDFRAMLP